MEEASVVLLTVLAGIVLAYFLTRLFRRKPVEDEYANLAEPQSDNPTSNERPDSNRFFTLAELKHAEEGKYSWDNTGFVFEINSDGSVTIVGRFDPSELLVDPVQEIIERLNNDGLPEMLPRMWSFHAVNNRGSKNNTFIVAWDDDILSVSACPHTIDEVKAVSLIPSSFEGGKSVITDILGEIAEGDLILMPCNENEYILSLGAKACIERVFGNKIRVKISSPAVMGAFGIAAVRANDKQSKISFAFGESEDYMCCNMLADNGIYKVQQLLRNSIIQPAETFTALHHIAKGCMVQTFILDGTVRNYLLLDMLPYTISFLLKKNGRVIKIYDCISEPILIPTRQGDKDINMDANDKLSFLIGSTELIEDIVSECNASNGKLDATVEIDSEMGVMIKIRSDVNDCKINVGELIG